MNRIIVIVISFLFLSTILSINVTDSNGPDGLLDLTDNKLDSRGTRSNSDALVELDKYASSSFVEQNETFNLTLDVNVIGSLPDDYIQTNYTQDVIFLIDSSSSSSVMDPDDKRLDAASHYVDKLGGGDRGAVIRFADGAYLVSTETKNGGKPHFTDKHLSENYSDIKANINSINPNGNTNFTPAMEVMIDEFLECGSEDALRIGIVLSDLGADMPGIYDAIDQALGLGIIMFVVNVELYPPDYEYPGFRDLVNITGGEYYRFNSSHPVSEAYQIMDEIYTIVEEDYINSMVITNAVVTDTLPEYVTYLNDSSHIPYSVDISGSKTTISWTMHHMRRNDTWSVTFAVLINRSGYFETNIFQESHFNYTIYDASDNSLLFPRVYIQVGELSAPLLKIFNPKDGFVSLSWSYPTDFPISDLLDYLLIFRSEDMRGFDFSTPLVNTSIDFDPKSLDINSLRFHWNLSASAIPDESYYIGVPVTKMGVRFPSSNTVGAKRAFFTPDWNDFSLPFAPCEPLYSHDLQSSARALSIKTTRFLSRHVWTTSNVSLNIFHGVDEANAIMLLFENESQYIFTGYAPSSIHCLDNRLPAPTNFTVALYNETHFRISWDPIAGANSYYLIINYKRSGIENDVKTKRRFYPSETEYFYSISTVSIELAFSVAASTTPIKPMSSYEPSFVLNSSYSIAVYKLFSNLKYCGFGLPFKIASQAISEFVLDNSSIIGMNYYDITEQRWVWHRYNMPQGVYDEEIKWCRAYQISSTVPFEKILILDHNQPQ
jgi:hypothetical protein